MKPLGPPHSLHLQFAQKWIDLGNYPEASRQFEAIAPRLRSHPDALKLRWEICAAAAKWEACLDLADRLILWAPEDPQSWLRRARSLHRLSFTEAARDCLLAALLDFPRHPNFLYDLAVYECALGRLPEARDCLQRAFALGGPANLKLAALQDPAFEPLWKVIAST